MAKSKTYKENGRPCNIEYYSGKIEGFVSSDVLYVSNMFTKCCKITN